MLKHLIGADKLKQYAKEIGRDDVLHVLKLDVTKDESVNDARASYSLKNLS